MYVLYSQEFSVSDTDNEPLPMPLSIHIAYPSGPSTTTTTDPVNLLFQFSPVPHVAVMTGTCHANSGEANLGDVVVVTPRTGQSSLFAEVEHMIEVWKLQNETLVPENLKPPQSVFQQMVCLARIYTELQVKKSEGLLYFY